VNYKICCFMFKESLIGCLECGLERKMLEAYNNCSLNTSRKVVLENQAINYSVRIRLTRGPFGHQASVLMGL